MLVSRHYYERIFFKQARFYQAAVCRVVLDCCRAKLQVHGPQRNHFEVDVWGLGLRAGIDRAQGRDERADALFERARAMAPRIWGDERLSAAELR